MVFPGKGIRLHVASVHAFRYKLHMMDFVVAGSRNGPCLHWHMVGTLETDLSLNLTPALAPTGWDLQVDPIWGLDRGRRGSWMFAVLSSILFPFSLTLSSTCYVLSQIVQTPLCARTVCLQCLAKVSKQDNFPIPSMTVMPILPGVKGGDVLPDAQPPVLSGRAFPFPSQLLHTDSGPHGSTPRAGFIIKDHYPALSCSKSNLVWCFLLGRRGRVSCDRCY